MGLAWVNVTAIGSKRQAIRVRSSSPAFRDNGAVVFDLAQVARREFDGSCADIPA